MHFKRWDDTPGKIDPLDLFAADDRVDECVVGFVVYCTLAPRISS